MSLALVNDIPSKFPVIVFRKKRLTVAIHVHFDLECAQQADSARTAIEDAIRKLGEDGHPRISYSVADL